MNCLALAILLDDACTNRGKTKEWLREEKSRVFIQILFMNYKHVVDTNTYKEMMRMTHETFLQLLQYIEPRITLTERVSGNKIVNAKERLGLTIRFLAIGESYRSFSYQFRVPERTISYIIKEVVDAITHYIKMPSSPHE